EGRPVAQSKLAPGGHRVEAVAQGLTDARARKGFAAEISRLEAVWIARLGEERARPLRIEGIERRRPVVFQALRDEARGDTAEAEGARGVDGLAVDREVGGQPPAAGGPGRPRV